ncbi:MAG: recombinase family protein [Gammaproteobacteria bacterium]
MANYIYLRTSEYELSGQDSVNPEHLDIQLEQEQQALRQYCVDHNWALEDFVVDHSMAWHTDFSQRDEASKLLARLQAGDTVLVYALERAFSSCYDANAMITLFKDRSIALQVLDLGGDVTDAAFELNMITAAKLFAGLERRRSVERIKNVKKNERSKGRYLGGSRPFGFMIHSNGRLIENPMEQKVLKRILQLRDQGKSLRAIADEVTTPVAPISFKTVQRILQRNV